MNRRGFLRILGAGIAGVALEQAIPLGRVWSFPKKIIVAPSLAHIATCWYDRDAIFRLGDLISIANAGRDSGRLYRVTRVVTGHSVDLQIIPAPRRARRR